MKTVLDKYISIFTIQNWIDYVVKVPFCDDLSLSYLRSNPRMLSTGSRFVAIPHMTTGKSGQTPSISFRLTGVLAVQEPKVRDSGDDVVTQELPLAIFATHAPMYATLYLFGFIHIKIKYIGRVTSGSLSIVSRPISRQSIVV